MFIGDTQLLAKYYSPCRYELLAVAESAKQAQEGERLMKCYSRKILLTLFVMAIGFYAVAINNYAVMAAQEKDTPASEEEVGYTEEEYAAWETADKETDPIKSGTMLLEFIKKYPSSKLMIYADGSYKRILSQCLENQKYQELETLAEQWNTLKPGIAETIAYIAKASDKLGHNEKYAQRLEELYKLNPNRDAAYEIAKLYKEKLKNESKYLQWAGTIMKFPESDTDFGLRYELMQFYVNNKDMVKAVEFAQATLKAVDLVKDPSEDTRKTMRAIRHQVNHVVGVTYYEQKKYADAIKALQHAIKAEKYAEGYYWIGMCQWAEDQVDDAIVTFAKAEKQGGDYAPKAKEKLELLYKKLHNDTTIGINKVYKKAEETPDNF
jgi:tetratricopeptide (TPR) repeat protein